MGYRSQPHNSPGGEERDTNDHARLREGRERVKGFPVGRYLQPAPMLFTRDGHNVFLGDMYRGQAAFLLCGGPSLTSHDLSLLDQRGIVTYAVNNAATIYRPQLWSCVDDPGHFADAIWRDPGIMKLVPLCHMEKPLLVRDAQDKLVPSTERVGDMPAVFGFRRNEAFVAEQWLYEDTFNWGNESKLVDAQGNKGSRSVMYVALRMLFYLGVRCVYLVGCDFRMEVGKQNYAFEQDRTASSVRGNNGSYQVLNARLRELLPHFEREGFEIYNCTPNSGLTVFPHCEFEEAVRQAVARSGIPQRIITRGMYDGADKAANAPVAVPAIAKENGHGVPPVPTAAPQHERSVARPAQRVLPRTPSLTWKNLGGRRRTAQLANVAACPSAQVGTTALQDYYRQEDQRYSELYRRGYGVGPIKGLLKWSRSVGVLLDGKSVLDCGCGQASLIAEAPAFTRYLGVDISTYQIQANRTRHQRQGVQFARASLDRLPVGDKSFDIGWCCDVLEHIPEQLVDACIGEILRSANTAVVIVSTRPSRNLDANGQNLHLTIRPAEWWWERFRRQGHVVHHTTGKTSLSVVARGRESPAPQLSPTTTGRPQSHHRSANGQPANRADWLSMLLSRIRDAALDTEPFGHILLNQVFPGSFYQLLVDSLPAMDAYAELRHKDAMQPDGSSARRVIDLGQPAHCERLSPAQQQFWSGIRDCLSSDVLRQAIFAKFESALAARFATPPGSIAVTPRVMLLRDLAGYAIDIHSDVAAKVVTMQLYLPRDDSQWHLGTRFHRQEASGFTVAKQLTFRPNSGYAFAVAPTDCSHLPVKSWHSVSPMSAADGPRDSLMLVYYLCDDEGN